MAVALLRTPTIQVALAVAFVLIVGLWGYTGYEFTTRMAAVEEQSARVTARYLAAQERLTSIRSQVLVASVHIRDALLEPDRALISRYEQQIRDIYATIDSALGAYQPVQDTAAQRDQVERLRRELNEFRELTAEVLVQIKGGSAGDVRKLLNQSLVPRREAAVRVSEDVQSLNRAAFVEHQREIALIHRGAERRTWQQIGLALIASLGIGLVFSVYAGRLESRLMAQMQTNEYNTRYLQQLSTRLIGAQEEERRHVARELHDEVGQALTAVQVELSVAQRRLRAADQDARILTEAETITRGALQTVRDISQLLHPVLLDDLGLAAAVEWQARSFEARHGIRVDLQQEAMAKRLPQAVELAGYRIVQEALTNIAKHARATTCRIVLRRQNGDLEITVEDDGRGFDPSDLRATERGLGLVGMHERAALLDGRVALESTLGVGTSVKVRLPVINRGYVQAPASAG
jgi:signal transduction histidine kinase